MEQNKHTPGLLTGYSPLCPAVARTKYGITLLHLGYFRTPPHLFPDKGADTTMKTTDFDRLHLTGWLPGHMLKAGREMRARLDLIDVVVEMLDARIPRTSLHPSLQEELSRKPHLLAFNKTDLADPAATKLWEAALRTAGHPPIFLDGRTGSGLKQLLPAVHRVWKEERERRGTTRPMLRPLRIMIAGIPNVGKSTIINKLAKAAKAAVGPKPGVTRGQQWVRLQDDTELLDTPGVLWPRIENKQTELMLGLIGALKDTIIGEELLSEYLWFRLQERDGVKWEHYGLQACPAHPDELLDAIALRRGLLLPGGVPDRQRAATALLLDFRDGQLGRITFDLP